jgi:predicted O-linked N-acetylglucosamine transferase (SPINDLY family)
MATTDPSPTDLLNRAVSAHRAGRPAEAERLCRAALAAMPEAFNALHLLGVILAQSGRFEDAWRFLARAVAIEPRAAAAHLNLGNVQMRLGLPADALASYDRAVALRADYAEAHYSRGNALLALGRAAEALASFDQAVAIRPAYPEALTNRANALADLKRLDEAVASFDRALAVKPDHVEALNDRGNALVALGRHAEALSGFDRALAIRPGQAGILSNRSAALRGLGRLDEALAGYDAALAIAPDHVDALNGRGVVLHDLRRHAEAVGCFDRALGADPNHAATLNNRGNALMAMDRIADALQSYDRALAARPGDAEALNNRGMALLKLGRFAEAAADFTRLLEADPAYPYARGYRVHARMHGCDWRALDRDLAELQAGIRAGKPAASPLTLLGVSAAAAEMRAAARVWAQDKAKPAAAALWRGERYRHDRIRLAYLSADFRDHAVARLLAGVLARHDRARFETMAVSFGTSVRDAYRQRLEGAFEHFIDVRDRGDREVAALLRRREVDIAVDLMGYTQDSRPSILAARPAPIQANYLGFPATMGADFIDYIIADRFVIPPERAEDYTEKPVYLPDTFQANDARPAPPTPSPTRGAVGLPGDGFVFCCFNNSYKITPAVFDVWMRLLRAVAGSVLWLLAADEAVARNLRQAAEMRQVAPDRLIFAPRVGYAAYVARYRLADLFLDTLPFNGGTTASDALWAGLPLLTCCGEAFHSRMAGSLLRAAGVPELVTHSLDDYAAVALRLARDPAALSGIRARLVANRDRCPLFDTDRFRRHLEAGYQAMWDRCQRGEPPAELAVEAIG